MTQEEIDTLVADVLGDEPEPETEELLRRYLGDEQ